MSDIITWGPTKMKLLVLSRGERLVTQCAGKVRERLLVTWGTQKRLTCVKTDRVQTDS